MKELVDYISQNGISAVIIAYMLYKDWYLTKSTNVMLTEIKSLLTVLVNSLEIDLPKKKSEE